MPDVPDKTMPPWMTRAMVLFMSLVAFFLVTIWLVLRLRGLLVMLLMALVISFALEPAVNRLERLGMGRGSGTLLTFLVTTLLIAGFLFVVGRLVATQVVDLIDRGPEYIRQFEGWFNSTFDANISADTLLKEFNQDGKLGNFAKDLAPGVVGIGAQVLGLLFQGLTLSLFTFYLVADGPRLRRTVCSAFPPARQREILRVWELGIEKTGGYIFSRVVLAGVSMIFHWAAFTVIGIPSPLALALWIGVVSQFVPVVGTYLAGVLPILIALADHPFDAVWVMAVILVYQQIENYLLAPRITAHTLEIHPAVAFGSVLAGSAILGAVGALLALPVAATSTALASTYFRRHELIESHLLATTRQRTDGDSGGGSGGDSGDSGDSGEETVGSHTEEKPETNP